MQYHFTFRYVLWKTFSANSLSHRDRQPGNKHYPSKDPEDDNIEPVKFEDPAVVQALYGDLEDTINLRRSFRI